MTELQPTEIELTSKKRAPISLSKRRILAYALMIAAAFGLAALSVMLVHRASRTPDIVQTPAAPVQPDPEDAPGK
jgi:hypothetical protein